MFFIKDSVSCIIARRVLYQRFRVIYHCSPCSLSKILCHVSLLAVFFIKDSVSCIIVRRVLYQRFCSRTQSFRGLIISLLFVFYIKDFIAWHKESIGLYHDHHIRRVLCIDNFTKRLLPHAVVWIKACRGMRHRSCRKSCSAN